MTTTESPTPASDTSPPQPQTGFRTKTLVIIAIVTLAVWAFAIQTGSVILMSIVGVLTLVLAGILIWAFRMASKQKRLAAMLQAAADSPEARREAITRLAGGKDANQIPQLVARAQLIAMEDPAAALALLEPVDVKKVSPQMQDDVALLKAQLYLTFGRTRDARPLADLINVDSPQRQAERSMIVAVVAEVWGRTGRHEEALALLETVDIAAEKEQLRGQLLTARAFARFASGKRAGVRADLNALADLDVNFLGKFLSPQFKAHIELQKLARGVAERHPQVRKMAKSRQRRGWR